MRSRTATMVCRAVSLSATAVTTSTTLALPAATDIACASARWPAAPTWSIAWPRSWVKSVPVPETGPIRGAGRPVPMPWTAA